MSFRIIVSIAALVIFSIATVSTSFARTPSGTTRLYHHKHHHKHYKHHHGHTVHHSGQVRHY